MPISSDFSGGDTRASRGTRGASLSSADIYEMSPLQMEYWRTQRPRTEASSLSSAASRVSFNPIIGQVRIPACYRGPRIESVRDWRIEPDYMNPRGLTTPGKPGRPGGMYPQPGGVVDYIPTFLLWALQPHLENVRLHIHQYHHQHTQVGQLHLNLVNFRKCLQQDLLIRVMLLVPNLVEIFVRIILLTLN